MELKKLYLKLDGDYEEVISRCKTEERIEKYVRRFAEDTSCESLQEAWTKKNYEEAFRHAHSLKGLSNSLGFPNLGKSSSDLCEALRSGIPSSNAPKLLKKLIKDHRNTLKIIRKLTD